MKKPVVLYNGTWPNDLTLNILKNSRYTPWLAVQDLFKQKEHYKPYTRTLFLKNIHKGTKRRLDVIHLVHYTDYLPILDALKPDLIISNLYYMPTTRQMYHYAKKHNIPYILQTEIKRWPDGFGGVLARVAALISRPMLRYARFILPWTVDAVSFAKQHFRKNNVFLMPAGVDTSVFKKKTAKKNKKLTILMIARMVPYKRYHDALHAMKYLKEQGVDFVFNIRGDGPLEQDIKKTVVKLGLQDYVNFLPKTPYKKMPDLLNKQDLLILPSFNEAIGMVVPEAMACGLPVVVSDTAGATTYFTDGKHGYQFRTGDSEDLARKILMLNNRSKRERMGRAAANHIKKHFDIKKIAQQFDTFIERALR